MDLGALEEKAYRSTFAGGILDVLVGVALLIVGCSWLTDYAVFGGLAPILVIPFWPFLMKHIVEPRIGFVQLSPVRVRIERRKLVGYFVLGVIAVLIGIGLYAATRATLISSGSIGPLVVRSLPGGIVAIAGVFAGVAYGLHRFLYYAAVAIVSAAVVAITGIHPGWNFIGPGIVTLVVGLVLMIRFVRRYPVQNSLA